MPSVDDLIRRAQAEASVEVRAKLRRQLLAQPNEWLVEQLLDHLLARTGLPLVPEGAVPEQKIHERDIREQVDARPVLRTPHRVRPLDLTESIAADFTSRFGDLDRDRLVAEGYLVDPSPKGGPVLRPEQRTPAGEDLLATAKDLLYWLLFGRESDGVRLTRVERELLTLTVPRAKLWVFEFIREAATEIGAEGTWDDPEGSANDDRAANTVMQVEYGEVDGELVGHGIVAALRLINNLEINEQILYARMENVEQSTLI